LEVASLVAEATEGKDPNLVIAALLHDAIEDCEVPYKLIAKAFGTDVADLVAEVTDDKTLEKAERKKRQIDTAHEKTDRAKVLKLADKISNVRTLVSSPAADWSVRRRIEYIGPSALEGMRQQCSGRARSDGNAYRFGTASRSSPADVGRFTRVLDPGKTRKSRRSAARGVVRAIHHEDVQLHQSGPAHSRMDCATVSSPITQVASVWPSRVFPSF